MIADFMVVLPLSSSQAALASLPTRTNGGAEIDRPPRIVTPQQQHSGSAARQCGAAGCRPIAERPMPTMPPRRGSRRSIRCPSRLRSPDGSEGGRTFTIGTSAAVQMSSGESSAPDGTAGSPATGERGRRDQYDVAADESTTATARPRPASNSPNNCRPTISQRHRRQYRQAPAQKRDLTATKHALQRGRRRQGHG